MLEWLYTERDLVSTPSPEELQGELAERWNRGWRDDIRAIRDKQSPDAYLRLASEMLLQYLQHTIPADQSTTIALEKRVSIPISPGLIFTGMADRVARSPEGRLLVIDYKTSSLLGDPSDLSEGLQVPLYAICLLRHYNEETALVGYHYLRHATAHWQEVNPGQELGPLERFRLLATEVMAATELPPTPGPLCAWCGYNQICDAAEPLEAQSSHLTPHP